MSKRESKARRRQALGWIGLTAWSAFVFVLGGIVSPILGWTGQRAVKWLDPPKASLRLEILEQVAQDLSVYVTNGGDESSVIESLWLCPPNKGSLVNFDNNQRVALRAANADNDALQIVDGVFHDRLIGWEANCDWPARFVNLPLVNGDRRVASKTTTLVTFKAPEEFLVYSMVGRESALIGAWCSAFLKTDNAHVSKVFPCAVGAIPGEGASSR